MSGNTFKAIIFDLDGVLIHPEPLYYKAWEMTFPGTVDAISHKNKLRRRI